MSFRKSHAAVLSLASLLAGPALGQSHLNSPAFHAPTFDDPGTTRKNLGVGPGYISLSDPQFGAAGDAQRAYGATLSNASGVSPLLGQLAGYTIEGATVNCTAGSNSATTITLPAGSLPAYIRDGITTTRVQITACGAGGVSSAQVNSIVGSGPGPYTLTTDLTATSTFSGVAKITFEPLAFLGGDLTTAQISTSGLYHYGTGSISGATLTMPTGTFNILRDLTQANASGLTSTKVAIDDPAGVCPQYRGRILSSASTTTATLDPAPACVPSGANLAVWWGPLLFPANVVTGPAIAGTPWSCEMLRAGTANAPLILPVGGYIDPFHVTMSGTAPSAAISQSSALTCGTPDDTALNNAATAAFNAGFASIYLPPGHNYFDTTGVLTSIAQVSICSDGYLTGRIFYPANIPSLHNAARCMPSKGQPLVRGTIDPKVHLAHSLSVTGRPLRAAMFSDSLMQNHSNGMGDTGSGDANLFDWLTTTTGKSVQPYNFSVGGALLAFLAPNMAVNSSGNGIGIPTTAQIGTVQTWYTNSSQKWIDYGKNACVDVVFLEFGNDQFSFLPSTFYDVNGYLNTAWQTPCGFTPDIIWVTGPGQSASAYGPNILEAFGYFFDFQRSAVLSGDTMPPGVTMGNGGAVGLLDFGARYNELRYGVSPLNPPMTRAVDVVSQGTQPNTGVHINLPYTWPRPVRNWQLALNAFQTTTANITSSTFWNTFLAGSFNIPLGNGSAGTPWLIGGQSSPAQTGFPNNMLSVQRDAGGNLATTGYTYRLSVTATCAMVTTTLTCTTPVGNAGYYYSNIIIQGAGAAACPADIGGSNCLFTSIAAAGVNNTGKIITTVASGTLSSSSVALIIYRTFSPYTVSVISAAINNGSDGSPVCAQCGYATGMSSRVTGPFAEVNNYNFSNAPVFNGPVTRFGGRMSPVYTAGLNGAASPSNQWTYPLLTESAEDADDITTNTPVLLDADCWGQPPGYVGPQGGGYSGHMATECMKRVLNDVLAANAFRTVEPRNAYTAVALVNAATVTMTNGQGYLALTGAGVSSQTINLPAVPPSGGEVWITIAGAVTTLTVQGQGSWTVTNAPTSSAANAGFIFKADAGALVWRRAL
jgi:hypothetical protein